MKIKILLMPLLILMIVILSIWLVYPAYSNGVDGVKENYAKLKSEQAKIDELQNKSENINNLSAQISSLPEKEVLYSFVPENGKEEEIINDLVNLSALSGLLFYDSNIDQPAKENATESDLGDMMMLPGDGLGDEMAVQIVATPLPEMKNMKASIKLAGKYEKVKEFLNNLEKLGRNSDIKSLEIGKNSSDDTASANSDILSVNAVIDFGILKKNKLSFGDVPNPVFSNPKLETKVIEKIKNQKNIKNYQISVDQKGKANIFQP